MHTREGKSSPSVPLCLQRGSGGGTLPFTAQRPLQGALLAGKGSTGSPFDRVPLPFLTPLSAGPTAHSTKRGLKVQRRVPEKRGTWLSWF